MSSAVLHAVITIGALALMRFAVNRMNRTPTQKYARSFSTKDSRSWRFEPQRQLIRAEFTAQREFVRGPNYSLGYRALVQPNRFIRIIAHRGTAVGLAAQTVRCNRAALDQGQITQDSAVFDDMVSEDISEYAARPLFENTDGHTSEDTCRATSWADSGSCFDEPIGAFSDAFDMDVGINPASGLPMLDGCIDVGGNAFGTDGHDWSSHHDTLSSSTHSFGEY